MYNIEYFIGLNFQIQNLSSVCYCCLATYTVLSDRRQPLDYGHGEWTQENDGAYPRFTTSAASAGKTDVRGIHT